ncbi:hypothetical protein [Algibacillus agarilyticus]|uniref:hypothetical protein n=1 Tax=Algibacillus agarilyticus TaxID=2234133 RepID=UPI000DCF8F92|nr:hypothetical protein [Algibacillus agarilyticus]
MKLLKTYNLVFVLAVFVLPFEVYALSCAQMHDRIIAECNSGSCIEFFYVREVPSHGACSRRSTIQESPEWAKRILEFEISARNLSNEEGLYELEIENRYWSSEYVFSNAEEYIQLVEDEPKGRYFHREFSKIADSSMSGLKNEWANRAQNEHMEMILWKIGDWLSLAVSLVFLVFSIVWFNNWIAGSKGIKWLFVSITGQSVIMLLAFLSVTSWNNFLIAFMGLLIPGVWFYEIVHFIITLVRRKSRLIG